MNFADDEWILVVILWQLSFRLILKINALNIIFFHPIIVIVVFITFLDTNEMAGCDEFNPDYCCNHQSVLPASSTHTFHCSSSCSPSPALYFLWLLTILFLPAFYDFSMNLQRVAPGIISLSPLRNASISFWHLLQIIQGPACLTSSQLEMIPPISALSYLPTFYRLCY